MPAAPASRDLWRHRPLPGSPAVISKIFSVALCARRPGLHGFGCPGWRGRRGDPDGTPVGEADPGSRPADSRAPTTHLLHAGTEPRQPAGNQVRREGSGADVGILLKVSLPGREVIEVADLVQVKKANSLIPSASGGEAWQINRLQLDQLLRVSPTAVYWLIAGSGDVMAVPAKVLLVTGLMKTGGSARFTVGHSDIRHAAVGLEHYFTDLITGLWLGSTSDETVAAAKGLDPRNRPEFFLTIDVMFTQQRDELRG